jgi:hydrogenase maturation protease
LSHQPKILVYGFGNPGRQDDILGIAVCDAIEKWAHDANIIDLQTDSNYQLNIEDADRISDFDLVIFADASTEEINDCLFTPLEPSAKIDFTMHSVSPAFILNLCGEIYNKRPEAYLLHIKGYEWEFMEEISIRAEQNLNNAVIFLKHKILEYLGSS